MAATKTNPSNDLTSNATAAGRASKKPKATPPSQAIADATTIANSDLQNFQAAWRRADIDFGDEELREMYEGMSESQRTVKWNEVRGLAAQSCMLVAARIPKIKAREILSGWKKLLALHHVGMGDKDVSQNLTTQPSARRRKDPTVSLGSRSQAAGEDEELDAADGDDEGAKGLRELAKQLQASGCDMSPTELEAVVATQAQQLMNAPVFDESQARRRTTVKVAKKKKTPAKVVEDDEEESDGAKRRKNLPASERRADFPALDLDIDNDYPQETRLSPIEILEIGIQHAKGAPRKKGKFVENAGYLRHKAAPYAYTYYGKLRRCYWGFVKMCYEKGPKMGQRIWSEELISKLCGNINHYHEQYPAVINAAGSLYRRLPPQIKPLRTRDGKFRAPVANEPRTLTDFGRTNALVASIKGEDRLINIKNFTATDVGLRRITAADEEKIKVIVKAQIEEGRFLGLQKDIIPLLQTMINREVSGERRHAAADRLDLEQRLQASELQVEEVTEEFEAYRAEAEEYLEEIGVQLEDRDMEEREMRVQIEESRQEVRRQAQIIQELQSRLEQTSSNYRPQPIPRNRKRAMSEGERRDAKQRKFD